MHPTMKKTLAAISASLLLFAACATTVTALEPHGTGIKMRGWLINDPDYDFSDAYKTSVWYKNFTSLELSDNERNNVLRIAISQLGYHEGDCSDDFHGMNTNGSNNYIEYARLLVPNYNDNSYEWCACFVNWCLNQAHIDYVYSEIGCWKWTELLKPDGLFQDSAAYGGDYMPKPADMIFFNWKETNTGSGHIGYVLYATDTTVYTIEGNSENCVAVRSYPLDSKSVIGYGTPAYDEGDEPTMDLSYTNGMPAGTYVVHKSGVIMRTDDGNNVIIPIGSTVLVSGTEGTFVRATYDGRSGKIAKNNVILMVEDTNTTQGTETPETTKEPETTATPTVTTALPETTALSEPVTTVLTPEISVEPFATASTPETTVRALPVTTASIAKTTHVSASSIEPALTTAASPSEEPVSTFTSSSDTPSANNGCTAVLTSSAALTALAAVAVTVGVRKKKEE